MSEPHLIPTATDRGLKRMPPIAGGHYGDSTAEVMESSNANGPHIYARVTEYGSSTHSTVELPLEAALRFAEQIQFLAANHYQLRESTPNNAD